MAVLSFREILPRVFSHKFGEAPTAELRYAVTLDEPTSHQAILNSVGIFHGTFHPEFSYLVCVEGSITETDRQHAEVTYRYELPPNGEPQEFNVNPMARRDVWTFSVGGAQVPALTFFNGDGNGDVRPLVNAADDFFEGIMTNEAEVRATINGNRLLFDLPLATNVTNCINASPYLGGAARTWMCAGIGAQQTSELVGSVTVRYWQITVELIYRRSGWPLRIPHVGWHYLAGTGSNRDKKRAYVLNEDNEKVPASAPQPLTETGALKYAGREGLPDLLDRRVNPVIEFEPFFGKPF